MVSNSCTNADDYSSLQIESRVLRSVPSLLLQKPRHVQLRSHHLPFRWSLVPAGSLVHYIDGGTLLTTSSLNVKSVFRWYIWWDYHYASVSHVPSPWRQESNVNIFFHSNFRAIADCVDGKKQINGIIKQKAMSIWSHFYFKI